MDIAVTGANGFIGRHLLEQLRYEEDVNITAIVRPGTKIKDKQSHYKLVYIDISLPPENVYEFIGKPDVVIHLAWQRLSNYKSLNHYESELPMQYRFLKLLLEQGLQNLLVTGTCLEYGMQSGGLSSCISTKPSTSYGFAKDMLRKQLEFLQSSHNFNLTWARLFYMYGESQSASSLYPILKQAVKNGDKTFKMSGGEQLRDYLPVMEVANQLVQLAQKKQNIGAVNICSGKPVSIRKLVEQWLIENNWNIELELGSYPYPDYEPFAFWGIKDKKVECKDES